MTRRGAIALAVSSAALTLVLSACSEPAEPAAPISLQTSSVELSPTPPASSAVSSAATQGYEATTPRVSGTRSSTTFDVHLPQLRGGDAAVRARFNSGMRSALDELTTSLVDTTVEDGQLLGDEHSAVTTITDHVVAGVAIFSAYSQGAAHPNNHVATITIDADTAQPVLLTDVVTDPTAAAQVLTDSVNRLDPRAMITTAHIDNFLNWVPLGSGLRVYVPVGHALGDYLPVTVPWTDLTEVLQPGIQEKLGV
ncbi:hypothetical protein [Gordonia rhizosphera]|uniref:DUF3298 domain-containing protein n=1 Tax=Gordonia rhizosphera NBRC 16068 TaxID=1108045 RepID=K6V6K2_9ACTN|nr:hypothetical protein [Gordonia rhizosphera]GAB91838.1 hypothetical protein GORHZ_151_00100 [Gordonia rhizosphera NBRC 16068]